MRLLPTDLAAEFQKEYLRFFFMVEFGFSTTVRYNDTEENIYDSLGNLYLPRGFKFADIETLGGMAVSQLDIELDNTDQVISALLLNEDCRNKVVKLLIGAVTQNYTEGVEWEAGTLWGTDLAWSGEYTKTGIITQEFFRGIVGGWTLSQDNKAEITIKNEMVLWSKRATRIHSSTCPWVFKGIECTYAGGGTSCDQSYDMCTTYGNTDNFGGFRFLPSMMAKELWWGRSGGGR